MRGKPHVGTIEMPVTPAKHTAKSIKAATLFMLIPLAIILNATTTTATINTASTLAPNDLQAVLDTETVLIDSLRQYIETLELKTSQIKRKTLEIKAHNDEALQDSTKYVNNPINGLTMIKRFIADWPQLREYAGNVETTDELLRNITKSTAALAFPTEEHYDEAVENLLRLQDIYKLEPQRLSVGEVHGVKLGSEMSWSDCLEIGRESDKKGDYLIAKFWIETALGKLPAEITNNSSELVAPKNGDNEKARFQILQSLLNTEYHLGNLEAASEIVNELMLLKPTHKGVLKAKQTIEKKQAALGKRRDKGASKSNKKVEEQNNKSSEESLIKGICRHATSSGSSSNGHTSSNGNTNYCTLSRGNLGSLLLQPHKFEILSSDPYIVIYHDVATRQQIDDLKDLLDENTNDDADDGDGDDFAGNLKFTPLAKKRLRSITQRLQQITGHATALFADEWRAERFSFADIMDFGPLVAQTKRSKIQANVLLSLQASRLGGAIVFPQLELSVHVPPASLLYWSNLNEFREHDYRTVPYVCPVIAGTQIAALTTIRQQ